MTAQSDLTLIWGTPAWLPIAAGAAVVLLALLVWGYWRAGTSNWVRLVAGSLKALGIAVLVICLLEPMFSGTRARPGANLFIVLTDNSQSMTLRDKDATLSRADEVKSLLSATTRPWLARLREDFDVRDYAVDSQIRAVAKSDELTFDGRSSHVGAALARLMQRYQGRPLAGVILFSDGAATDAAEVERFIASARAGAGGSAASAPRLPPIYPVLVGRENSASDIGLERVAISQTNFEDAPVTLTAHALSTGYSGRSLVAQLVDDSGKTIEQQKLTLDMDGKPSIVRFQLKPASAGVSVYRVRVAAETEIAQFENPS